MHGKTVFEYLQEGVLHTLRRYEKQDWNADLHCAFLHDFAQEAPTCPDRQKKDTKLIRSYISSMNGLVDILKEHARCA